MRIHLQSDAVFVAGVAAELANESGIRVVPASPDVDMTRSACGLNSEETAILITTDAREAGTLADVLRRAHGQSYRQQDARLKSALDIVWLSISAGTTTAELARLLEPLVEPSG